jgi:hypothetical protein
VRRLGLLASCCARDHIAQEKNARGGVPYAIKIQGKQPQQEYAFAVNFRTKQLIIQAVRSAQGVVTQSIVNQVNVNKIGLEQISVEPLKVRRRSVERPQHGSTLLCSRIHTQRRFAQKFGSQQTADRS